MNISRYETLDNGVIRIAVEPGASHAELTVRDLVILLGINSGMLPGKSFLEEEQLAGLPVSDQIRAARESQTTY